MADMHFRTARTTREADFSRIASSLSGVHARVHCWLAEDWTPFAQDYDAVLPGKEFRGVAGVTTFPSRIDLSPDVCGPLRLFFRGSYTPYFNTQSYELAEAIVALAHEAEHLRTPDASEAVVECHALQRARAVVRMAGRRPRYQKEIAALAWQVGYPQRYELPDEGVPKRRAARPPSAVETLAMSGPPRRRAYLPAIPVCAIRRC